MNTPIKDNAQILSDQQAFMESFERAREFFGKIDGVVGVGFGQKETGGQYREDIAIVVFVREKKNKEELSPEQRIPASFEGYRTDVRVVHKAGFDACDNTAEYKTIQGGIQISARMDAQTGRFEQGTLGSIVRKRNDSGRENVYLLSNLHVLFGNGASDGDYIYHPFPPTADEKKFARPGKVNTLGPTQKEAFIGNVQFRVPGDANPTPFFVDCAIARVDIDSKCFGSTCTKDVIKYAEEITDLQIAGVNTIKDVRSVINDASIINQKVFKVGRTTGRTVGIVRLIGAPVDAPPDPRNPGGPPISGLNTIQIDFDPASTANGVNCKGNARFTEVGDSGALVLDDQGRVIGIHALGAPPGSPSTFPSNACHILPVLDNLNICIPCTTGTSHGSSKATDGSGIAPATVAAAGSELPSGQIGFTSSQVKTAPDLSPGLSEQVPVTEQQVRHLHELLDAFRATPKGRNLHDVFAEVRREIGYLVRNCRPVKVEWHRNKGPAFFAHVLNHLKGDSQQIPAEVDGVALTTLLARMDQALTVHGSRPLRVAIEQYREDVMSIVASGNRVEDYIAYLRDREFE